MGWAEAERKPLTDHVHDWHAGLIARGRCVSYAELSRDRVLRLIEMNRAQRMSQLTLSAVQTAVGELRSIPGIGQRGAVGCFGESPRPSREDVREVALA